MKVGDLIKFDESFPAGRCQLDGDKRHIGTVLKFDVFQGGEDCSTSRGPPERIVEILWNTGKTGWILQERVEVIDDD